MKCLVKCSAFIGLLLGAGLTAQAAPMLYGINPFGNDIDFPALRQIDPASGAEITSAVITLAGEVVNGGNGLATNPLTGELFAVLKLDGQSNRQLVTLDPLTGVATNIGNTGERIAGLTFDASGTLYGVSGDGGNTPTTLFTINTTTAALTSFVTLGNGNDGETISFNPDDGKIYHTSGLGTPNVNEIFESVDLGSKVISAIALSGDDYDELLSMVWDPSQNLFLGSDLNTNYVSITAAGVVTKIGNLTDDEGGGADVLRGLAFYDPDFRPPSVPEPASLLLLGLGIAGLSVFGRRRR